MGMKSGRVVVRVGLPAVLAWAGVAGAGPAQAQDAAPAFSVSAGLKAWNTQWTTFSYAERSAADGGGQVVTQVPSADELVLVPQLGLRWRDWFASFSAYPETTHDALDGNRNRRRETDFNLGYYVLPAVAVSLGYKTMLQTDGRYRYEPAGPVLGISATAPLGSGFTLYGAFGMGWLKTDAKRSEFDVDFESEYRVSEVGVAYNLPLSRWARAVSFTAGYRSQVFSSRDALPGQDGRDISQGLAFGVVLTF